MPERKWVGALVAPRVRLLLVGALLVAALAIPRAAFATSLSDNFNRANGGLGSNWTTVAGTAAPQIVGSVVTVGTASALNSAYWSANTFGGDQFAQASLPNSSSTQYGPGIAVRLSSSRGYFLWYGNSSSTVSLWRMDSSTSWTQLGQSAALTVTPSTDVWKITAVGSTISGYQNGNLVVQAADASIASGSPGVWLYYASNQIANWSGGDVAPPPTYTIGGSVAGLSGSVVLQDNGGNDLTVAANGPFTFGTALTTGAAYSVTVRTNPAGQTCTVANGSGTVGTANVTNVAVTCSSALTYSIGGTVSGLSGTAVLQDDGGDNLSVSANGSFTFATRLGTGSAYDVTVLSKPSGQTCAVSNRAGTVASANVTNVGVTCASNPPGTYSDDFNRADGPLGPNWTDMTDGGMAITSQVVAGSSGGYSGDIRTAESYTSDQSSQVEVTATQLSDGQWIGPAVRAQNGGQNLYLGLYWWNNGSPVLMLFKRTAGAWTQLGSTYASGALPAGTQLKITAAGSTISFFQDGVQRVTATDASLTGGGPGIMADGTPTADNWVGASLGAAGTYSVGGTVSGLAGSVVLQDNGGGDLTVSASGAFTFSALLASGASYNVTVRTYPTGQTCSVASGSGTVASANVTTVAVTCSNSSGSGADNFNRADGPLGPNWTDEFDGGLAISSQVVAGTSASGTSGDIRTAEAYSGNQYSQVEVTSTQLTGGQWIGPAVRMQNGGQNGYVGTYSWNNGSPELMLFKRTNGAWSQLGSTYASGPLAAGTQLKLMVVGTTLAFTVNGAERIAAYDNTYTGGAPGIVPSRTGRADNWSGGSAGFEVHYLSTDASGIESYDVISANNGDGPQILRVLRPTNPAAGVAHNFLYALPVEAGLGTSYGDGMATLQAANAQNQYNVTIIEPSFQIEPWFANNPNDPNLQYETFMTTELQPWVKANLTTTGKEQHWLLGFSKSGIGGQDLLLKHPDRFTLAGSWDFPADMSSYDQFGSSSAACYGTDGNFQANYRLSQAFVDAHRTAFVANNRIWIGGYDVFGTDMADYNALLTSEGIQHSTETPTAMAHRWDSGWVPIALAALARESANLH